MQMAAAEGMQWSDAMLVGHCAIDAAHREFVDVVSALARCTAATAAACLADMERHAASHFEIEESRMEATGFPATECHVAEHRKVLEAVQKVRDLLGVGQVGLADVKRLAQALMDWFPGHADYMDSALAAWLSKKNYGGAPIVMRRGLLQRTA